MFVYLRYYGVPVPETTTAATTYMVIPNDATDRKYKILMESYSFENLYLYFVIS